MSKTIYNLDLKTLIIKQGKDETKSNYVVDEDFDFGSIDTNDLILDMHNKDIIKYPGICKL